MVIRVFGWALAGFGTILAMWALVGLADRHTDSEDDWPMFLVGAVLAAAGVAQLVAFG
jgi:hypothetical protein